MRRIFVSLFAVGYVFCAVSTAWAGVSQEQLSEEIGSRITRVPEFEFIRQEAGRLGVRAWLFGGTAAGFAHYVKWDLDREHGDHRFQPERFDYDYTNIYRSTQDLDIVVDGTPEKAAELERRLTEVYPHLQGSKTAWEVRLLRQDLGDKQALLNNPDFLNQHTDSNSTGMIEITKPGKDGAVVRDLRDWDSKAPFFLKDVHDGTIHYYYSPRHFETSFYKAGRNPPILSVVRYLTKAFQYGLKIRDEDLAKIKPIIDSFDPRGREMQNSYVRHWLLQKDNGRKLFQAASDLEYAWNTLEKLGLRRKLIAIEGNPKVGGSLAWWMNKEPLRSEPVGEGSGKTAAQLGIKTVAHDTRDFRFYESITQSPIGAPNVFISRDAPGEKASGGAGFYTMRGEKGLWNNGLTIRFEVNPNAREDTDFKVKSFISGDEIIFKNRNALRVIPESTNVGISEFFEGLASGKERPDRAVLQRLSRRISNQLNRTSPEELKKTADLIFKEMDKLTREELFEAWFAAPVSARYPELFKAFAKRDPGSVSAAVDLLSRPQWAGNAELTNYVLGVMGKMIRGENRYGQYRYFHDGLPEALRSPVWKGHPELVITAIQAWRPSFDAAEIDQKLFSGDSIWLNDPVLKALCGRKAPNTDCLTRAIQKNGSARSVGACEENWARLDFLLDTAERMRVARFKKRAALTGAATVTTGVSGIYGGARIHQSFADKKIIENYQKQLASARSADEFLRLVDHPPHPLAKDHDALAAKEYAAILGAVAMFLDKNPSLAQSLKLLETCQAGIKKFPDGATDDEAETAISALLARAYQTATNPEELLKAANSVSFTRVNAAGDPEVVHAGGLKSAPPFEQFLAKFISMKPTTAQYRALINAYSPDWVLAGMLSSVKDRKELLNDIGTVLAECDDDSRDSSFEEWDRKQNLLGSQPWTRLEIKTLLQDALSNKGDFKDKVCAARIAGGLATSILKNSRTADEFVDAANQLGAAHVFSATNFQYYFSKDEVASHFSALHPTPGQALAVRKWLSF